MWCLTWSGLGATRGGFLEEVTPELRLSWEMGLVRLRKGEGSPAGGTAWAETQRCELAESARCPGLPGVEEGLTAWQGLQGS